MGGWEIFIALIGGAWYVFSAIAASKEKKKKQARRKTLLDAESLASNQTERETPSLKAPERGTDLDEPAEVSLREKSDLVTQLTPQPTKTAKLKAGADDLGIMREARKAILESMRKELGLPSSKPGTSPPPPGTSRPPRTQPAQAATPPVTMPGAAMPPVMEAPLVVPAAERTTSAPKRRRAMPAEPKATGPQKAATGTRSPRSRDLKAMLQSRSGLQQAIVMAEILQPPVSMREQHLAG